MADLSILIPSRSEPYLQQTIEDIFEHREADTEVIVGLDNATQKEAEKLNRWYIRGNYDFGNNQPRRFFVIYSQKPIGQRALVNQLAEMSAAKFLLKIDAHCSFSQGFDRIMLEDMNENDL